MRGRKFSGSTQSNNSDAISIKNVIQDIAQEEIKKFGFPTYKAAIVQKINDDGTVDVYLPPNKENLVTNVLNKCGEILMVNDSVEIATKNGSLTNCWVALKHGTIVQGHAEEVKQLSGEVVMKVQNGRLSVTELQRDASLGNAFTIIAEDINLDGMNIVLNGSRGITITSPYFNVTSQGYITATGGTIGGWTLGEKRLYSGTGTNYVALDSGTSGVDYAIWAGNATAGSAPFRVTRAGAVTATSGKIGNWNISSGAIKYNDNIYLGSDGNVKFGSKFSVNTSGEITATGGTIGGWSIGNNSLHTASNNLYLGNTGITATIGGTSRNNIIFKASSNFGVDTSGNLYANSATLTSATVSGSITATSGTIGNCSIDANGDLKVSSGHITSLNASVINSGTLSANYISGGTINGNNVTVTNLSASNITGGTLNCNNVSVSNFSAGSISGGTMSAGNINLNSGTVKLRSNGHVEFTNGSGFFSMGAAYGGAAAVTHPYVSALNVANGSGGIVFNSGTNIGGVGSGIASIHLVSGSYLKIEPGDRLYIDGHYGQTNLGGTVNVSNIKSLTFYKGLLVGISFK